MRKEKWVALRPPSWGGGNRDDSGVPPHLFGGCPSISLVHVFALERLGFREGAFCVLHFLELVRDEFHAGVHEVTDRRAHGLRAAREVVGLNEDVERLQVPRGEAQRHLFRIRISHVSPPCIVGQYDIVCPTSVRRNSYTVFNRCWNFVKRRNLVSCGRPIVNRRAIFTASSFLTSRTNRLSHARTFERRDDGPSRGRVLASGPRQDGSARPPGDGETRDEPPRSRIQGDPSGGPHAHAIPVRQEGCSRGPLWFRHGGAG